MQANIPPSGTFWAAFVPLRCDNDQNKYAPRHNLNEGQLISLLHDDWNAILPARERQLHVVIGRSESRRYVAEMHVSFEMVPEAVPLTEEPLSVIISVTGRQNPY